VNALTNDGLQTEVVVVGGGPAGIMAALAAAQAGADVLLLEKSGVVGGTAAESNGTVWIPNNRLLREQGIVEDRSAMLMYLARVGWPTNFKADSSTLGLRLEEYERLVSFYDNAPNILDWMERTAASFGMIWRPDWRGQPMPDYHTRKAEGVPESGRSLSIDMRHDPGKSITWTGGGSGRELMRPLIELLEKSAVRVLVNSDVADLLMADGSVIGVVVRSGPGLRRILANRGVVFASGGYARNDELTTELLGTRLYGDYGLSQNTGAAITIARRHGLALGGLDKTYGGLTAIERPLPTAHKTGLPATMRPPRGLEIGDSMIMVDRTGSRFVNEKTPYGRKTSHLRRDATTGAADRRQTFQIYDERTAQLFGLGGPESHILTSYTLDGLVETITRHLESIDGAVQLADDFADRLRSTIRTFNEFARTGFDEDFDRGASTEDLAFHMAPLWGRFFLKAKKSERTCSYQQLLKEFEEDFAKRMSTSMPNITMHPIADAGPYYAIILGPQSVDTAGGFDVDGQGRVRTVHGDVVKGLFAAGSCTKGLLNGEYVGGGMAIGSALVSGWVSGAAAVELSNHAEIQPGGPSHG
jgi:3-oxosteroid 1-dehydrogenase